MGAALVVLRQSITMFLLAVVGFLLFRHGKISKEGSRTIANLLIYVSIPFSIVNGFLIERTPKKIIALGASAVVGLLLLLISMAISHLFFRKDPIASFGTAFSNAGFIGIPLIVEALGSGAVFYIASYIAILNLLQWTYGVSLLTGKKTGLKPKAVLTAPFMLAILVGVFLFLSGLQLPALLTSAVSQMSALNTPLAMFAVGVYLAQVDFKEMIARRQNYMISFVRLLVIPLASMLVLSLLPAQFAEMRTALFIASACPVGANVAVYAQLHNKEYPYAVETVVITTLLSIISLPIMVYLSSFLWSR